MSRAVRVETRSRHKDDIKRAMHLVDRVRKWEKKWVNIGDTSMQIYKWMPLKLDEQDSHIEQATLLEPNENLRELHNTDRMQQATTVIEDSLSMDSSYAQDETNMSHQDEVLSNIPPAKRVKTQQVSQNHFFERDLDSSSNVNGTHSTPTRNSHDHGDLLRHSMEDYKHLPNPTNNQLRNNHAYSIRNDLHDMNVLTHKSNGLAPCEIFNRTEISQSPQSARIESSSNDSLLTDSMDMEECSFVARLITEQIVSKVSLVHEKGVGI